MEQDKSEILGEGHGDKHNWKRLRTYQLPEAAWRLTPDEYANLKGSEYKCRRCGVLFIHRYDVIRDIFEAMKTAKVVEECKPQ